MNPTDLKKFSPMTWLLERLFFVLQYTSPAILLFGTRIQSQQQFADQNKARELTIKRGRQIEKYILIWFIVELLGVILTPLLGSFPRAAFRLLAAFRIFELFQSGMNLNVFDRLRMTVGPHYVSSVARTAILSVWNFFELMICFGIIYSLDLNHLAGASTPGDAYYFSVITQLTIGYGDLRPTGILRLAAAIQGLLGFLVALFAVSRIIAFLPRTVSVLGDE